MSYRQGHSRLHVYQQQVTRNIQIIWDSLLEHAQARMRTRMHALTHKHTSAGVRTEEGQMLLGDSSRENSVY